MAVTQCPKGHYYDNEKFLQCPHCKEGDSHDLVTVAFSEQQVENYVAHYVQNRESNQFVEMDKERTIGLYSQRGEKKYIAGWLVCVEGTEKGNDFRIYPGFNKVGRGYSNDIVLKLDIQVSREVHCSIVYEEKKNLFYIVPVAGTLTYLNGELLKQAEKMAEGSLVRIGECLFEFVAFCKGDRKWT